jgi:hypothetical protein
MTVHIVGAGLAGLSAALTAVEAGLEVILHEAAGQAGGRCRSWVEPSLDRLVDNGTHMVVGANRAVHEFLAKSGAKGGLIPGPAAFPMLDLADGARWTASAARMAPAVLAALWHLRATEGTTVADRLGGSAAFRRFWDPLAVAVMNTPSADASAEVFRRVVARTLWRGAAASRPYFVAEGLSQTFVQPALAKLAESGATIRFNHPLRKLALAGRRVEALEFDDGAVLPGRKDGVILATPWVVAKGFLPHLPELPASPIVNAHFRLSEPLGGRGFLGVVGGTAEWLFWRNDLLSVTVSAAGALADQPADTIADLLWDEASRALNLDRPPAARRIIKEKRATLFHTPAVERLRPSSRVGESLFLAGDWTATGLPCTLEGAIVSGVTAADLARLLAVA